MADAFTSAYHSAVPCHVEQAGDLHAIVNDNGRVAVLLGHPLWLHDAAYLNETQAEAYDVLQTDRGVTTVHVSDLFVLDRIAPQIYKLLNAGT